MHTLHEQPWQVEVAYIISRSQRYIFFQTDIEYGIGRKLTGRVLYSIPVSGTVGTKPTQHSARKSS